MRGARITYSREELAWIKACSDMARAELHALFVSVFGRKDVTPDNIKSLCTRKGWTAGPDGRRRNAGKSLAFTPDQMAWLRENATLPKPEVEGAFRAAFPGSTVTAAKIVSWRKRNGIVTGRTGRFEKGHVSANKGKKGFVAPGSEKGWFRKGQIPHTAKPDGYERIDRYGYVMIRVAEPNPWTGAASRMIHKHRWLWEQAHGPVPADHSLKCLDGDKLNTAPSNWACVPRALLPRLNGKSGRDYDHAPVELKPTILAIAKLEHKAREARRAKANA